MTIEYVDRFDLAVFIAGYVIAAIGIGMASGLAGLLIYVGATMMLAAWTSRQERNEP